jgi:hyperosmotically inducible protein
MRDRGLLKGLSILLAAGLPLAAAAPRAQADDRAAATDSSRSRPDAWITLKAKTKMLTTEGLPVSSIHVDTLNGMVTLYGTVGSQEEKARAEREVRELEGVRGVRNQLKVSGETKSTVRTEDRAERRSDDDIRRQAERTLKSDHSLAGSSVTVRSVDNGVVTLAGRAESDSDQYRALRDISGLPGVKRVSNEIQVSGESGTRADTGAGPYTDKGADKGREHMDSGRRTATRATGDAWITTDVKSRLIADG